MNRRRFLTTAAIAGMASGVLAAAPVVVGLDCSTGADAWAMVCGGLLGPDDARVRLGLEAVAAEGGVPSTLIMQLNAEALVDIVAAVEQAVANDPVRGGKLYDFMIDDTGALRPDIIEIETEHLSAKQCRVRFVASERLSHFISALGES